MKALKLLLLVSLLSINLKSYSQTKEVVYVNIHEVLYDAFDSFIHITYPDQSSKWIDLEKHIRSKGKEVEENDRKIHAELSKLINDGYVIQSSSTGGDATSTITIIILVRTKEK